MLAQIIPFLAPPGGQFATFSQLKFSKWLGPAARDTALRHWVIGVRHHSSDIITVALPFTQSSLSGAY